MRSGFILIACFVASTTFAQKEKNVSMAVTNNHTAFPFQKFGKLFTSEFHPGLQVGYGFNWSSKKKHDWHQQFAAGYFYHRFVQHAIPLYTSIGYRYKFSEKWGASVSMGGGYLHSIPDVSMHKLNDEGEYENGKGIGRGQAMFQFALGPEFRFKTGQRRMTAFIHYQQMLQTPFINSYVPLLPYNSIAIGLKSDLNSKKK